MSYFDSLPRTFEEAVAVKSKYYYTNGLCKHKHLAPRYTSSKRCIQCNKKSQIKTYLKYFDDPAYMAKRRAKLSTKKDKEGRKVTEVNEVFSGKKFPTVREAAKYFNMSPSTIGKSLCKETHCSRRGSNEKYFFIRKAFIAQGKEYRNPNRFKKHN